MPVLTRRSSLARVRDVAAILAAGLLVSCAQVRVPGHAAAPTPAPRGTAATSSAARAAPGWTVVSRVHATVLADRRTFHERDGAVVTIYRFWFGRTTYALHTGSEDPPGVASLVGPAAGPSIAPAEARRIIGAFNGGFKVASGSGGFEVGGRVFVPLRRGLESLVIDANGTAHVAAWGGAVPSRNERVVAVRQNLQPLVSAGRPSALVGDLAAWGDTLGGVAAPARSALGQNARGDLLFAGSMQALPVDIADALVAAGAVRAMELDINPYWVQLDSTPHPGGRLVAGIPSQERPGDQYVVGWTRDFVTVLARTAR